MLFDYIFLPLITEQYMDWPVDLVFHCFNRLPVDGPQVPNMLKMILIINYILRLVIYCSLLNVYSG